MRSLSLALTLGALGTLGTLATLATVASCTDDTSLSLTPSDSGVSETAAEAATDAAVVVPKGARVIGATLDFGDPSFYADLADWNDAGGRAVDLAFGWDEMEVPFDGGPDVDASTAVFAPALHAVNLVLPDAKTTLAMGALAVDIGGPRLPIDLQGRALDDPAVMTRFDALTDYVLDQLRDTSIDTYLVADRVDYGNDSAKWSAFASFVAHARAHGETRRPGLLVGFSVDAAVLTSQPLLATSAASAALVAVRWPAVTTTEIPQNTAVTADSLRAITAALPADKPVVLLGLGYPASPAAGGSPTDQALFVERLFAAWDGAPRGRFSFAFLDDPRAATVAAEASREGRGADAVFAASYGSLGLREGNGRSRPAWDAFRAQAKSRGF